MKINSLIKALGPASLVLTAACATTETANRGMSAGAREISITEFAYPNTHWKYCENTATHSTLTPILQIADVSVGNRNIYSQVNFLALVFQPADNVRRGSRDGALRGFDYILKNQNKKGDWLHPAASTLVTCHRHTLRTKTVI